MEQSGNAYTIYYLNASGIQLVVSEYRTETADTDALVRELLDKMEMFRRISIVRERCRNGSKRSPTGSKEMFCTRTRGCQLCADEFVQEILCRAALTKTLTQIPGIEYLSIYCAEQPITDAAGNPVGMLSASDFVDSIRDVNSFERTELTLYFANETGDQLVEEKREVMQNSNTSLERLIVEQLIEGPQELGHYATIPSDVKLLNVSVNDSVCSINFNAAFLNSSLDVAAYIPIYSIVDSLAELSTVSRVQIRINGSQDDVFRDQIPLSTVFERNYDYIVGGKND